MLGFGVPQPIERTEVWNAADNLRAHSKLTSSEYCMPVLGVILMSHATNRYNAAKQQIVEEQAGLHSSGSFENDTLTTRPLL